MDAEIGRSDRISGLDFDILNAAPLAIIAIDLEGRVIEWNAAAEKIFGWKREEVLGQPLPYIPEEELESFKANMTRTLTGDRIHGAEYERRRKDGSRIWIRVSNTLLRDEAGRPSGFLGIIEDISEFRKTRQDLLESEARYRGVFEASPVSLWEEDGTQLKLYLDQLRAEHGEGLEAYLETHPEESARCASLVKILDVNPATLELFGAESKEEFLGGLDATFSPESYKVFHEEILALEGGALSFERDHVVFRGAKGPIHAKVRVAIAPGCEESWSRIYVSLTDIGELVAAEKRLSEAFEREQSTRRQVTELLESMSDGFVALDRNWHYRYINAQGAALFGRKAEDLIGKHIWTEFPEGLGQPFHLRYEEAMREQKAVFFEDYYEPWDRYFENRVFPSKDGLSIFYHDITTRVTAEKALLKASREWRTTFDSMIDPVLVLDRELRILRGNLASAKLTGCGLKEMVGHHCFKLVHQAECSIEDCPVERSFSSGAPEKLDLVFQDRIYLVTADPIRNEHGEIIGAVHTFRDVTESRQARRRLETLHELTTAILEARSVEEIAEATLANISGLIAARRLSLALFDEETGKARVFARGLLEEEFGLSLQLPLEDSFPDIEGLRKGEIIFIEDLGKLQTPDAVLLRLREAGILSALNIPMRASGVLLGSLNLGFDRPGAHTEMDIEVGREVADTIAIALEQARLHESLESHAHDLETRVEERTSELRRAVSLMAGREIRMAELKKVIKTLRRQLKEAGLRPEADDPLLGDGE